MSRKACFPEGIIVVQLRFIPDDSKLFINIYGSRTKSQPCGHLDMDKRYPRGKCGPRTNSLKF